MADWLCAALFITAVFVISRGTLHELRWRGNFADTVFVLRSDGVYLRSVSAHAGQEHAECAATPGAGVDFTPFLGIYGFHALVIHALRTRGVEFKSWPLLDIVWIFTATLLISLLLSMLLQRVDTRRFVS